MIRDFVSLALSGQGRCALVISVCVVGIIRHGAGVDHQCRYAPSSIVERALRCCNWYHFDIGGIHFDNGVRALLFNGLDIMFRYDIYYG